ncbi:MFS transporter [Saccharopolyspora gloriosae]|uniref:MFS transporter n=1 Tax=Saccharopolyspora gloriosae TaxID=455344 RepID=UPI001FB7BC14|nr:MFS transporter [Saccharopolyspora gloriosae]
MTVDDGTSGTPSATTESALWGPRRRNFTAGLILVITLAAFEAMGIGTALPTIVREWHAEQWYSWPFTIFMAASAIGTVVAGRFSDRSGPAVPLLVAMPTFAAGLVLAGIAPDMFVLLVARALQGLGAGAQIVALYVLIARVYPERDRPAAFGALSAAWVVPALVGPVVAGALTEHVGWRWVFLGLAPLMLVGALLLVPTVRRIGSAGETAAPGSARLPLAAVGAAAGTVGLNWAAQRISGSGEIPLPVAAVGIAAVLVLVPSLRVLLPRGTGTGRPGIPVMVLARGLLAGVFFAAQAFVPLILSVVHGYSPTAAGIPLTVGSLGWSVGALWQSRRPDVRREHIVAAGLALVAVAVVGLVLIAPEWGPAWAVYLLWSIGGIGMGIGVASTSVRVLSLSAADRRGFHSSALQISDMLGQALLVGLGGVLVAALASPNEPTGGVVALNLALGCMALLGAARVFRSAHTEPAPEAPNPTERNTEHP